MVYLDPGKCLGGCDTLNLKFLSTKGTVFARMRDVPNKGDRGFTIYEYSYDGGPATYWLVWDGADPKRISRPNAYWHAEFLNDVWGSCKL